MYKKQQGFTLIEIMVVVMIIGILAVIVIPSYQSSVVRTNRVAVQGEMMQIASSLENFRARQLSYTGATLAALGRTSRFPASTNQAQTYALTLTVAANGITWVLRAAPVGRQQATNDGALAIDNLGRQCWQGGNNTGCANEASMADVANAWSSR